MSPPRQKNYIYYLVWLLCVAWSGIGCKTAIGFQPSAPEDRSSIDLAEHLSYLVNSDKALIISQVRGMSEDSWIPNTRSTFSAGFTDNHYWLKTTLKNSTDKAENWIFEVPYPLLDEVSFYYPNDEGYAEIKTGDQLIFNDRNFLHRHFIFPISIPANTEQTYYFQIKSRDTLQLPLRLWHPDHFHYHSRNTQLLYGLYFGALLILMGINLMAFYSLRDKGFLLYVATIFFYTISHANLMGFTLEYLFGHFPAFNKWLRPIAICLTIVFVAQFTKGYLDTKNRAPLFYSLLNAISWVSVFSIIATTFLPFDSIIKMALANTVLAMLALLSASIVCTPLTFAPARYFLCAWLGLIVSVIITVCHAFGFVSSNSFTEYSMEFGAMAVAMFLSYGLTNRVNEERKLKIFAQKSALKNERLARQEQERATSIQLESQKKAFEAQQSVIAAQSESRAKSNFLATMSHEIRTPMNGVLGLTELLMETDLNPKQEDYVKSIHSSGESLLGILNDILDFSKVEAKKIELEKTEFCVEALVDDIISIFSKTITEKKLYINFVLHHNTPRNVIGDPTRLRQILLNLVSNAIKFTEHGEIVIRAYWEQNSLTFEVQDTGIGINKEHQNRLFELFSQADQSTTRRYGGTGLGLAICKGLVELMGGSIHVHSRPGHGSTFFFSIKCEDISEIEQPKPPKELSNKSIILIDSNLRFIESMAELAAYWHANLDIVTDPIDLNKATYEKANLIICHQKFSNSLPKTKKGKEIIYLSDFNKREGHPNRTVIQRPATFSQIKETVIKQLGINLAKTKKDEKDSISFHQLNVLVAEDNQVNRMVIKGILNKLGIKPEFAVNGLKAVRAVLASEKPFDVIIMDCEMPEMDGYQATREIRQLEQQKKWDIKILGLSAHAVMEREQLAYEAGMNIYMTKPVQIDDVKKVLLDIERGQLPPPQQLSKSSSG